MPPEPPPSESTVIFWRNAMLVSIGLIVVPPLLGMAGTMFGMVRSFNDLSGGGMGDPAVLSENISFALITTAIGLVVSVVGLVCFIISLVRYLILRNRYQAAVS